MYMRQNIKVPSEKNIIFQTHPNKYIQLNSSEVKTLKISNIRN